MCQPGAAGAAVFGSAAEALDAVAAGLGYLASDAADAGGRPAETVAGLLRGLGRAESAQVAARSRLLSVFTAQAGCEADGHPTTRSWVRWQTRVTAGAAAGDLAWMRRLARHRHVAGALAAGAVSPSWARQVCEWTDQLPPDVRDDADQILLAALAGGADLADARGLFREMLERSAPPDGDGDGGPGGNDDDGFADRKVQLDLHWRGQGYLTGNLTPECAAALMALLESLGKKAGPEDDRTPGQRSHDALEEACRRLVASGCLPEVAGQPTMIQLHATLDQLRDLADAADGIGRADSGAGGRAGSGSQADGGERTEAGERTGLRERGESGSAAGAAGPAAGDGSARRRWAATGAFLSGQGAGDGEPGWLGSSAAAEAYCCDARIAPITTGFLDPQVVADALRAFLDPDGDGRGDGESGRDRRAGRGGGSGPSGRAGPDGRLQATVIRYALDMLSGPGGLAAQLRSRVPGVLGAAVSLPLDVGAAVSTVPPHLRRAVARRDRRCAFPGCRQRPAVCQVHHLIPRAKGGATALWNLTLLCSYHHLIAVHRQGWRLVLNADGTTTATSRDGRRVFHSHGPPASGGEPQGARLSRAVSVRPAQSGPSGSTKATLRQ